ncbi:hypothetical protein ABPG72_021852 [Tetrahymena utriculariae]
MQCVVSTIKLLSYTQTLLLSSIQISSLIVHKLIVSAENKNAFEKNDIYLALCFKFLQDNLNSVFETNSCKARGGAIYIYSDVMNSPLLSVSIADSKIIHNIANIGGGIFQQNLCVNSQKNNNKLRPYQKEDSDNNLIKFETKQFPKLKSEQEKTKSKFQRDALSEALKEDQVNIEIQNQTNNEVYEQGLDKQCGHIFDKIQQNENEKELLEQDEENRNQLKSKAQIFDTLKFITQEEDKNQESGRLYSNQETLTNLVVHQKQDTNSIIKFDLQQSLESDQEQPINQEKLQKKIRVLFPLQEYLIRFTMTIRVSNIPERPIVSFSRIKQLRYLRGYLVFTEVEPICNEDQQDKYISNSQQQQKETNQKINYQSNNNCNFEGQKNLKQYDQVSEDLIQFSQNEIKFQNKLEEIQDQNQKTSEKESQEEGVVENL